MMMTQAPIDLRSDAITRPTDAMWEAMRGASLGWAIATEDPSVNELQALAAEMTGKEAALFTPTSTMANLVSLMTHTKRGDQILLEASSHILWSEEWGFANICGLVPRVIQSETGSLPPNQVRAAISQHRFQHHPHTALICIENTHNATGGTIVTPEEMAGLAEIARENEIPIHLDGARVLNACVALEKDLRILVADAESVVLSLCKGLSAPGGALLCGPKSFIERCASNLRVLGGGSMHQAGVLAAAGLVALKTMVPRLAEDNRRAQTLARAFAGLNSRAIGLRPVQTNIVIVSVDRSLMSARSLLSRLEACQIRASLCSEEEIRFVTHRHIRDEDIERVAQVVGGIVQRD